uniref:Uncharacterized protein n=1 Tax=Ciona intestinalis TaxID=7719 RepID=H2XKH6_CIOIN
MLVFIFGSPSAWYILKINLALCLSACTPSGRSKLLEIKFSCTLQT